MPLVVVLDACVDLAGCIADCCGASDALALSGTCTACLTTFAQQDLWKRYIAGPAEMLARPVLAEPASRAAFAGAFRVGAIHGDNLRAVVAALRQPNWAQHYPSMRRLLAAGRLRASLWAEGVRKRKAVAPPAGRQLQKRISREQHLRNELDIGISKAQQEGPSQTSTRSLQRRGSVDTPHTSRTPPRRLSPCRSSRSDSFTPQKVTRRFAELRRQLQDSELVFVGSSEQLGGSATSGLEVPVGLPKAGPAELSAGSTSSSSCSSSSSSSSCSDEESSSSSSAKPPQRKVCKRSHPQQLPGAPAPATPQRASAHRAARFKVAVERMGGPSSGPSSETLLPPRRAVFRSVHRPA